MRKILLAGAAMVVGLVTARLWFTGTEDDTAPAAAGAVIINATATPEPEPAAAARAANLPTPPDQVIAHVRQAYPVLTDVDFACDTSGCAVTATIPPPTGDAFLQKRQEMLLGGLARTVGADGYDALGPVQMDEVSFNTFRIRAAVKPAK